MRIKLLYFLVFFIYWGCKKENESNPKACFTLNSQSYTLNDAIIFSNCSELSTKNHWVFDNESTSDDLNPTYLFKTPGNKKITLVCSNELGKKDSISQTITILNEKYINIEEKDNIRVFPVAMKIISNGIYVISGKYNIDNYFSISGVLEKYDFQFNKIWEKNLGSTFGNAPKGDMVVTSNDQLIILIRNSSSSLYQYIYLMDTLGNIINKQELYHFRINGMIEQTDKFIFCGSYISSTNTPCIFQTDKNLNSIDTIYFNEFGNSYTSFLGITNSENPIILGQKRNTNETYGSGNYFLYFLNNNFDSLSFSEIPVGYNLNIDNWVKIRESSNNLYIYDFKTIYCYDLANKILNSKSIGDGYIRAFEKFDNQFLLYSRKKIFTYDLGLNMITEMSNPIFENFSDNFDYFIDVEHFSDNKYLFLGSYEDRTTTFLGYAEHLRFFIYGKD